MKISKDGMISWMVPRDFKGSEKVVVLIFDAADGQTWHSFEVAPASGDSEAEGGV